MSFQNQMSDSLTIAMWFWEGVMESNFLSICLSLPHSLSPCLPQKGKGHISLFCYFLRIKHDVGLNILIHMCQEEVKEGRKEKERREERREGERKEKGGRKGG